MYPYFNGAQISHLNLLIALDALLQEGSVVAAARRMNLSALAMSRTLSRIRQSLGDPVLVRAGRKGQKTGGGWYDYAAGDRTPRPSETVAGLLAPFATAGALPDDIAAHLVGEMAAEGAAILAERIAARPEDIDLVEIHGYGFPRRKGGPMHLAAARAAEAVG